MNVIDEKGFRANVGIIICNNKDQVFWARRIGQDAWQFPQGGMSKGEQPEETLYRELREEVGLEPSDIRILSSTRHWLYYRLPQRFIRRETHPVCIGQKQKWFLIQTQQEDVAFRFDRSEKPEFSAWKWVSYWYPLQHVVIFKREVYRRALKELAPTLFSAGSFSLNPFYL
jgi:putative (di)nucleoside polyphosphate hydrolase